MNQEQLVENASPLLSPLRQQEADLNEPVILNLEDIQREEVVSGDNVAEQMDTDEENERDRSEPDPIEPSISGTKTHDAENSDDCDPGSLCAICYSPYTNSGEHRLSCLKCGHLFGESCIKHWLKNGCHHSARRCPSCNTKATLRDIRVLYAKNLIALDTTEKDRLMEKLEKVQSERNSLEGQLNAANLKIMLLYNKIKDFEVKINELIEKRNTREQTDLVSKLSNFSAKLLSSFTLSQDGGCRVLAFTNYLSLLVASQASMNPLFPGFGVRKFNMHDMKPTYFHNIHKKAIRDMSFSQHERGHLLSVSLDNTAKLFDIQSNTVVQTFQVPVPLWSCGWSSINSHKFYCGSQNGTCYAFDRRQPGSEPEQVVETFDPKDKSGIISICHIPPRPGRFMPNGGIIACRLNNIVAHYPLGDHIESKVLPIEGSFMSMRYNPSTDHLLISTKASTKWTTSRHIICQLATMPMEESDGDVIDILHTFYGSRFTNVLSRSSFVSFPNGDLTVCAYNSRSSNIDMWSVVSDTKLDVNDISIPEPVLDICSFNINEKDMILPCLSDKKLSVIKLNFDK